MKPNARICGLAGALMSLGALAWLCATAAAAEAAVTTTPGSEPSLQIPLESQELAEPLETFNLRFSSVTAPFAKEPDLGRHRIVRGALGFGGPTNNFTRFLWDQTANRLYLDLNDNQDLTDDPEAPFPGEYDGYLQLFPRLKLSLESPSGRHSYLVDLRLGGSNPGQLQGTCAMRSIWQGRLELGGRAYQVGLAENPLATTAAGEAHYFLFRPWDARNEPIRLNPGTPHLVSWSPKIFIARQAFSVAANYKNEAGVPRYLLTLTPTQPPLGQLRASGQFLYRLVLQDPVGYSAILDSPVEEGSLPAGNYRTAEVWLRHGTAEAFYIGPLSLIVRANESVSLVAGGPLTNTVTAQGRGVELALTYRLTGQRGLDYRMTSEDRTNPPSWRILANDKELASGKFAYG
ncbi:MAG TPA: hypothetical protein VJA21_14095 [Verrucomicrobiae bacterium]